MKALLSFLLSTTPFLIGAASFTQNFSLTIPPSSSLSVSKNPDPLTVFLNSKGSGNTTDSSSTYTVSSNTGVGKLKIIGSITSGGNMPANTTLSIWLSSNSGKSAGTVTLSTTAVDLVKKISSLVNETGKINYTFSVQNGWTIPAQTIQRTVTLTLVSTGSIF